MANYYTYGTIPNAEETVYGPLSEAYAEGGEVAAPKIPPGLQAAFLRMQGKSPEQLAAKEKAAAETRPQREVLSSLLQNNQFDSAFKYAKDNNVQNLLIDPTELKTLRGPFSNDEMKSFFNAMPKDLMGEQKEREVKFTPDKALEQSLQVAQIPKEGAALGPLGELIGYPDVQRAFEPQELVKEMTAFDKLIRAAVIGGVAYAGGTALAGLGGAGGAGAASAGGTGGGLSSVSSAVKSVLAIPETIGIKIGEALGYNTLSTLQAKMIGNAVISGGVTGAKGGDLGDVLKSAAMAAGLTFVSDKAIKAVTKAVQDSGLLNSASKAGDVLQGGVETIDDATASNITQGIVDNLDQVNVITNTGGALTNAATTLTSVAASQPSTKEPEVKVETTRDQIEPPPPVVEPPLSQEPPVDEQPAAEEEVKVETERDQPTTPVVTEPTPKSPLDEAAPEKPEEEVKVETEREPETPPVVTTPTKPPLDEVKVETEREPETPPVVTTPTKPPLDEVKVETEREPETPPVVTTPTKPPLDEVKVETEREPETPPVVTPPPKDPLDEVVIETDKPVKDDIIIPPIVVPPTTPVDPVKEPKINKPDPLKDLKDKYLNLENILKLIGAIGSATSKTPQGPTDPSIGSGGMGGALPKYTYTRKQLSPDMDYYTYGTRPEAKFFEGSFQLEKPVQPPLSEPESPPANPPGNTEDMVMGAQVLIPATVDGVEGYYTDSTRRNFVPYPINTAGPLSIKPQIAEEDPEFYKKYVQDQNVPSPLTPVKEDMRPSGDRVDWFNLWTQKSKMSPERYDEYVQRMAPLSGMSEGDYRNYLSERSAENAAEIAYRQSDAGRAAMLAQQEEARRNAMNAGLTMSVPEPMVEPPKEPGMAMGGLTGYAKGGSKSSRYVDGPGSGREDKIPALLSDGEYVIDAETLALLGDGSTKEGARRMDKFRANIRKHKGRALSRGRISPNAKSPDKYMGGGLT